MIIDRIALIIMIIGGINLGSIGLFNANFLAMPFGAGNIGTRIIYTIIAVSAVWSISLLFRERSAVTEAQTPVNYKD